MKTHSKSPRVVFFSSLEEENQAEYSRRARMTVEERLAEFAVLQERAWGSSWTSQPIVKIVTFETVPWHSDT